MKKTILTYCLFLCCCALWSQVEEGCFSFTAELETVDGEWEGMNDERTYSFTTLEACQAKRAKVGQKEAEDSKTWWGRWEVKNVTSCQVCGGESDSGSSFSSGSGGSRSGAGGRSSSNRSGSDTGGGGSAITTPTPGDTATPSAKARGGREEQGRKAGNSANGSEDNQDNTGKKDPTGAAPEPDTREQLAEIALDAAPGIQNAFERYRQERENHKLEPSTHDTKPEGFYSSEAFTSDWVIREEQPAETTSDEREQRSGNWLQEISGYLERASQASEILGYEERASTLGSASKMMDYIESADHLRSAIVNPKNDQAKLEVIQDALSYTQQYAGVAGMATDRFAPPVNLYQDMLKGAFQRAENLIETGDPGDEIEVTAPLMNWFGSVTGMGNLGTRERNYRLESYRSFSELKNKYGWIEATKQKAYNWMRED